MHAGKTNKRHDAAMAANKVVWLAVFAHPLIEFLQLTMPRRAVQAVIICITNIPTTNVLVTNILVTNILTTNSILVTDTFISYILTTNNTLTANILTTRALTTDILVTNILFILKTLKTRRSDARTKQLSEQSIAK